MSTIKKEVENLIKTNTTESLSVQINNGVFIEKIPNVWKSTSTSPEYYYKVSFSDPYNGIRKTEDLTESMAEDMLLEAGQIIFDEYKRAGFKIRKEIANGYKNFC